MESAEPILEYSSNQSDLFRHSRKSLLIWAILNILAAPFGLFFGIGGLLVTILHLCGGGREDGFSWNLASVADWIGFVLWCANALSFIALPPLYTVLCFICWRRLNVGNITGLFLAQRLCRWAMRAGLLLAGSICFALGKATIHGRWAEGLCWSIFFLLVLIYGAAVQITKRTLQQEDCGLCD